MDEVSSPECPVSLITPESKHLVQICATAQSIKDGFGAAAFGTDASKWPAPLFDLARIFQDYCTAEKNAQSQAHAEFIERNRR